MKRAQHFMEETYSSWFQASVLPSRPGWYECEGFRFNGHLHLFWNGFMWLYFGSPHHDPSFPSFGAHPTDRWRGLHSADAVRPHRRKMADITGNRYGMLVALQREYITPKAGSFWMFQCDCGNKRVCRLAWVTHGNTASCGCSQFKKLAVPVSRPWARN